MPENGCKSDDGSPYAGRWIARLRGKIVAHGGTPDQARAAAKSSRSKETPEIAYMPTNPPLAFPPLLDAVRRLLPEDQPVYLVGGAVRDLLLGRPTHDLDFALAGGAIKLARRVANGLHADFYPLDPERDTGRVIVTAEGGQRAVMDFAAFRGAEPSPGLQQFQTGGLGQALETDLRGRDFSLNAIALDLGSLTLIDPLGGALDLRAKQLRACSPAAFRDDPVRILRGVRLAAVFGFHILPETRQAMKAAAWLLPDVSAERLRDELFRILEGPDPAACLRALDMLGALAHILPEIPALRDVKQPAPHVHDVWIHTLATLQYLESILAALAPEYNPETASDLYNGLLIMQLGRYRQILGEHFAKWPNVNRPLRGLLFWEALYHDAAKPRTRSANADGRVRFLSHEHEGAEMAAARARALQFSNSEIERLWAVIDNHMRFLFHVNRLLTEKKSPSRRAIYRFFRDTGAAGVDAILLGLADLRATYEHTLPQETWAASLEVAHIFLENWFEKPAETVAPPPLLDGKMLMKALELPPGAHIGLLLETVREAQAAGKISDKEEALAFGRGYLAQMQRGDVKGAAFVNEIRLVYFQRPGTGIPLVLLHGFPLDHSIWQPLIPFLEENAYLILPDLRGHGATSAPEGTYLMETMADDIAGLLDYLKIRKAVIIGHSMGGYAALAFARLYPQRLLGLGLIASRADADPAERRAIRHKLAEDTAAQGMKAVADAMAHKLTADAKLSAQLRELMMKMQPAGAIGTLKGMARRSDSTELLDNLKMPVMTVMGGADMLIPRELVQGLKALSLHMQITEISKAGHMPMMEYPQETAEAINKFMLGISRPGGRRKSG